MPDGSTANEALPGNGAPNQTEKEFNRPDTIATFSVSESGKSSLCHVQRFGDLNRWQLAWERSPTAGVSTLDKVGHLQVRSQEDVGLSVIDTFKVLDRESPDVDEISINQGDDNLRLTEYDALQAIASAKVPPFTAGQILENKTVVTAAIDRVHPARKHILVFPTYKMDGITIDGESQFLGFTRSILKDLISQDRVRNNQKGYWQETSKLYQGAVRSFLRNKFGLRTMSDADLGDAVNKAISSMDMTALQSLATRLLGIVEQYPPIKVFLAERKQGEVQETRSPDDWQLPAQKKTDPSPDDLNIPEHAPGLNTIKQREATTRYSKHENGHDTVVVVESPRGINLRSEQLLQLTNDSFTPVVIEHVKTEVDGADMIRIKYVVKHSPPPNQMVKLTTGEKENRIAVEPFEYEGPIVIQLEDSRSEQENVRPMRLGEVASSTADVTLDGLTGFQVDSIVGRTVQGIRLKNGRINTVKAKANEFESTQLRFATDIKVGGITSNHVVIRDSNRVDIGKIDGELTTVRSTRNVNIDSYSGNLELIDDYFSKTDKYTVGPSRSGYRSH